MTLLARWQQLLGIRPEEGRTVGLFFLHNFLLGIGTILVYVAANVILLENHPETSLPLAYGVAALAMMVAGQVYAHFEHQLGLQTVAVRVLGAVVVLMLVIGVLVALGHSVWAAVAIMTGYRVIYLLTNLEFWGVSAVVFDVRQGRRLFSVISSGDMPAKALGAVLAVLVHHHAELLWLLLLAFGAYVGALLVLRATGREHEVEVRSAARAVRQQAVAAPLRRWLGSSRLVLTMCLSMLAGGSRYHRHRVRVFHQREGAVSRPGPGDALRGHGAGAHLSGGHAGEAGGNGQGPRPAGRAAGAAGPAGWCCWRARRCSVCAGHWGRAG